MPRTFTALTIAGSDPSGGAGLQADLKTFHAHGVYGMAVVSALTVQSAAGVQRVQPVQADWVSEQLVALLRNHHIDAIKIGMLGDKQVVNAVADALATQSAKPPIVLDPVLLPTLGDVPLLTDDARVSLLDRLLPQCHVVTPNLNELEVLLGDESSCDFAKRTGVSLLVTGGHGEGTSIEDVLFTPDGQSHVMSHRRIPGPDRHGTGCTLSSAVAARLARGDTLNASITGAVAYVQSEIAKAAPGGFGPTPPLLHEPAKD